MRENDKLVSEFRQVGTQIIANAIKNGSIIIAESSQIVTENMTNVPAINDLLTDDEITEIAQEIWDNQASQTWIPLITRSYVFVGKRSPTNLN